MVEYDGTADGLFNMRRRTSNQRWLLFSRSLLDQLFSYIIMSRSTYTAATRHLTGTVQCFNLRRQDVVKLGTSMLRIFLIPPETARCPICGPNPDFNIIDGQALGCSDPEDAEPHRHDVECPVLDIPATKLCVVEDAGLRACINKILRSSTMLTEAHRPNSCGSGTRRWSPTAGPRWRAAPHTFSFSSSRSERTSAVARNLERPRGRWRNARCLAVDLLPTQLLPVTWAARMRHKAAIRAGSRALGVAVPMAS